MVSHNTVRIGLLCSRVRVEEKMLLAALRARDVAFDRIDPRKLIVDLQGAGRARVAWTSTMPCSSAA